MSETPTLWVEVEGRRVPLSIDWHAPPTHVFIGREKAWTGSIAALESCGFTRGDDDVWRVKS
jgi:hypothetical protein